MNETPTTIPVSIELFAHPPAEVCSCVEPVKVRSGSGCYGCWSCDSCGKFGGCDNRYRP